MSATSIPKPGKDFDPVPAGTWPGVCCRIVDLGTQATNFKGKPGTAHEVLISWELHDDETKTKEGDPMLISRRFTWSMSPKANLRKVLESWRGKPFEEADFGNFDIRNLLGAGCLIGVTHDKSKDGTATYSNVNAVMKLPKGIKVGAPTNGKTLVWLDDEVFDAEAFDKLSDKLRDKIKLSPEYEALGNGGSSDGGSNNSSDDEDDDTPF